MRGMGKWSMVASLSIGLAIVGFRAVTSQPPQNPTALTPVANPLVQLFSQVQPRLEEALGEKLQGLPVFKAVSSSDLAKAPDLDLDCYIRLHYPQLQGESLARATQVARVVLARTTVARYAEGTDTILVASDNARKIAAWDESLQDVDSEVFLQLAMVRETVRMQFDRKASLARMRGTCLDAEEFDALQTVLDGRAWAITSRVASAMGAERLFSLFENIYRFAPDDAPDPLLKTVAQTALQQRHMGGEIGLMFFQYLETQEMSRLERNLLSNPPRQMSVLRRPQQWARRTMSGQLDLTSVLASLEADLPAQSWAPTQQVWTPAMMTQVASMFGAPRERLTRLEDSWYDGRTLVWLNRSIPGAQIALTVVRHESSMGASAHFGTILDMERKQDVAAATCGLALRVSASRTTSTQFHGYDEAIRSEKKVAFGDGPQVPICSLLGRQGDTVVELTFRGTGADLAVAEKLFDDVLRLNVR